MSDWIRATKRKPCPVCRKPDWCGVSADGRVAHCMRVPNDRPLPGGGWVHNLFWPPDPITRRPVRRTPIKAEPAPDWLTLHTEYMTALTISLLTDVSCQLGVSREALDRLGMGYTGSRGGAPVYSLPMCDGNRDIIGIQLRYWDGTKRCIKGSRLGLFLPVEPSGKGYLVICEGATDTGAIMDLGYDAIGRPSCSVGNECVCEYLRHEKRRDVIVLADDDGPGLKGAIALSHLLYRLKVKAVRSVRILTPLTGGDARKWCEAGLTRTLLDGLIGNQPAMN